VAGPLQAEKQVQQRKGAVGLVALFLPGFHSPGYTLQPAPAMLFKQQST
jgi:hypothetical protein